MTLKLPLTATIMLALCSPVFWLEHFFRCHCRRCAQPRGLYTAAAAAAASVAGATS